MIESETIQNLRGPVDHVNPVPLNGGFGPLKLRVYHNRDGLFYLSHMLRRGFKILLNCVVPVNHFRSSADLRERRVMPCAEAIGSAPTAVEFVVFPFPLYFPPSISSRLPKRSKPRRFIALWLR